MKSTWVILSNTIIILLLDYYYKLFFCRLNMLEALVKYSLIDRATISNIKKIKNYIEDMRYVSKNLLSCSHFPKLELQKSDLDINFLANYFIALFENSKLLKDQIYSINFGYALSKLINQSESRELEITTNYPLKLNDLKQVKLKVNGPLDNCSLCNCIDSVIEAENVIAIGHYSTNCEFRVKDVHAASMMYSQNSKLVISGNIITEGNCDESSLGLGAKDLVILRQ